MPRKIADVVRARVVQLRAQDPPLTFQVIADRLGMPKRSVTKIMLQDKQRKAPKE